MKKTYAYHKPSENSIPKINALREMFSNVHGEVEQLAPKSRELSVALTHLENAAMWAIKKVYSLAA